MDEQNINPDIPAPIPEPEPEHIKPQERDWRPVQVPKKPAEVKPEPKLEPKPEVKLRYSGNMQEFRYGVKSELKKDLGTRLSAAERAGMTKILAQRGGKYLGTRKERKDIREFGKEQGWSEVKIKRMLREARKLKGETGG